MIRQDLFSKLYSMIKVKEFIKSDKSNLYHLISNDYYLEKNYDVISYNYRKNEDFCYKFTKSVMPFWA